MKDSETKSQKSVGEKLEAPIQLTPEQLKDVAGGMARTTKGGDSTATTGAVQKLPIGKLTQ